MEATGPINQWVVILPLMITRYHPCASAPRTASSTLKLLAPWGLMQNVTIVYQDCFTYSYSAPIQRWQHDCGRSIHRQATATADERTGEEPKTSSSSFDEECSLSGGMLLYNLDSGTLEPPSPEPPSPERQGGGEMIGVAGEQAQGSRRRKKRREKRIMTSLYVR